MVAAVIVALLAIVALAYVGAPLRRSRRSVGESSGITEAEARKRAALVALMDLEEERAVGKLSEKDFLALRAEYEAEAITALKQLDIAGFAPDDPFEAEIAAYRLRLQCPACGAPRPGEGTCPRCGA
ncbi:MAG: hypothetical protein ACRDJJ_07090 [Actinomycetota bacterium]